MKCIPHAQETRIIDLQIHATYFKQQPRASQLSLTVNETKQAIIL